MTPGLYVVCAMIWLVSMEGSSHPYVHLAMAGVFGGLAILLQHLSKSEKRN